VVTVEAAAALSALSALGFPKRVAKWNVSRDASRILVAF
jgi:hypothetical protein